jgi:hypothetical protein
VAVAMTPRTLFASCLEGANLVALLTPQREWVGCSPVVSGVTSWTRRISRDDDSAEHVTQASSAGAQGCPAADVHPAGHRDVDCCQGNGQLVEIAVIDAAGVELGDQLAENSGPLAAGRWKGNRRLDPSFDELHRREPRRGCACLLPGSLPARRRAPLGKSPRRLDVDRPTAPPAHRCRAPSRLHDGLDRTSRICARVTGRRRVRPRWLLLHHRCSAA